MLYAGQVLETGGKSQILGRPVHPYTKGLLASLPSLAVTDRAARLSAIPGQFPDLTKPVQGCVFAARCPFAEERCRTERQEIVEADGRRLRCWKASALAATTLARHQAEREHRATIGRFPRRLPSRVPKA